ncbi:sigma-70 family RNA polymerase sigma factor [Candidatus Micrarchaeota archaeon]|nr:sigma-70 family RNA polymerase sigma factor [Candidatus Micrarchaeota archaeon]MBD3417370.1 sigma-70 family RNA polymerase sigma factor [Candidatus Micrarchaeota archaeon]
MRKVRSTARERFSSPRKRRTEFRNRMPKSPMQCVRGDRISLENLVRNLNQEKASKKLPRSNGLAWQIVLRNRRLAGVGAKQLGLYKILPHSYHEDINSLAVLSLFHSARRWDPEKGTFANLSFSDMKQCIRQAIRMKGPVYLNPDSRGRAAEVFECMEKEDCTLQDAISRSRSRKPDSHGFRLGRLIEAVATEKTPSTGEGIFYGSFPEEDARGNPAPFSRSETPSLDSDFSLGTGQEEPLFCKERKAFFEKVFGILNPRERKILEMRFGFNGYRPHIFQEIGDALGVSRQRINQIYDGAFAKLMESEYADDLKELWEFSN